MTTDRFAIVETDNHDSDYPDERFVTLPQFTSVEQAQQVCAAVILSVSGLAGLVAWPWPLQRLRIDADIELRRMKEFHQ